MNLQRKYNIFVCNQLLSILGNEVVRTVLIGIKGPGIKNNKNTDDLKVRNTIYCHLLCERERIYEF
jgi:hypothetical protein